jgi:hypothetical protein
MEVLMNTRRVTITILLALLIGACAPATTPAPTLDVAAIYTAAAQTVIVEISATAAAAASLTPLASPTSSEPTQTAAGTPTITVTVVLGVTPGPIGTPLGLCDDSSFNPATVDVTYSDIPTIPEVTPGQDFVKTWRIRNTGACTWGAGYTVVYAYGEKMSGVPAAINVPVTPNQEVDVSVQFKAPIKAGQYVSTWRMANAGGSAFGQFFYVKIIVR